MCDTLGFLYDGGCLFAKNSDRSPNEPQVLEYHPARSGLSGDLRVTYITIPQAESTHAVLLSRPTWIWGAEMGVNDCGVCIGNEAVFTKGAYGESGLIGMDLVRLALERSASAWDAMQVIINLLEEYGQGGNCGFDRELLYNNAFLIQDREALYVLETVGKEWVYKQYTRASISNCLSIGADGDCYSAGTPYDFRETHTDPVRTNLVGAKHRKAQTECGLECAVSVQDCMRTLRTHDFDVRNPFVQGCASSTCMHFGGEVNAHSTASMVVSVDAERIVVWATGSSTPCISLFKPWVFGSDLCAPVFGPDDPEAKAYWLVRERFHRGLIGKCVPEEFYKERDALESAWITASQEPGVDYALLSARCRAKEQEFWNRWRGIAFKEATTESEFLQRWAEKNEVLK